MNFSNTCESRLIYAIETKNDELTLELLLKGTNITHILTNSVLKNMNNISFPESYDLFTCLLNNFFIKKYVIHDTYKIPKKIKMINVKSIRQLRYITGGTYKNVYEYKQNIVKQFNAKHGNLHYTSIIEMICINLINNYYDNITENIIEYTLINNIPCPTFNKLLIGLYDIKKIYMNVDLNIKLIFYKNIFKNILLCVNKIHDLGIIHNDLKHDNIMLANDLTPRIIDFGLANFCLFSPNSRIVQKYVSTEYVKSLDSCDIVKININGTMMYLNVDRKSYHSDIYSLGMVFLHSMINIDTRHKVFYLNDRFYIYKNKGGFHYAYDDNTFSDELKSISPQLYYLLSHMLNISGRLRLTSKELLTHSFFTDSGVDNYKLSESFSKCTTVYIPNKSSIIRYSINDIKHRVYETKYIKNIYHLYKNDKFVFIKKTNPYWLSYYDEFNNINNSYNYTSLDTLVNTLMKVYNYNSRDIIMSNRTHYLVKIFSIISSIVFYDDTRSYSTINPNQEEETKINELYNELIITYGNDIFKVNPVMIHIQYIILNLQCMNIPSKILLKIEKFLVKNIVLYIILQQYSCDETDHTIMEIIQCMFLIYMKHHKYTFNINFISLKNIFDHKKNIKDPHFQKIYIMIKNKTSHQIADSILKCYKFTV